MGIALDRFPMVSGIDQVKAIADPVVLLSVCLSADEKGIGFIGGKSGCGFDLEAAGLQEGFTGLHFPRPFSVKA